MVSIFFNRFIDPFQRANQGTEESDSFYAVIMRNNEECKSGSKLACDWLENLTPNKQNEHKSRMTHFVSL